MRCTQNCNAYSQHWLTERAQFFSLTRPNRTSHNQCFKMCMNWTKKFCLIHHIHLTSNLLTATFSHLDNFLQGKYFHNQKCFPRVCQIPKQGFLHCRSKQTVLAGKNVLIVMVPIFMNKDVCGPSYNDLKFMVRNHNHFCTNLIFSCVI